MRSVVSTLSLFAVAIGLFVPAHSQAEFFAPPPPPPMFFSSASRVSVNVFVPRPDHGLPGYGFGGYGGYGMWGRRYAFGGCYSRWRWCSRHRRCCHHRKFRSFSLSLGIGWGGGFFGLNLNSVRF